MAGEHITGARGAPPALHCAGNGVVPVHQPWPSVGQLMQMAGRNAAVHQGRASCSGPFERAILGSHASPVGLCLLPLGKRESWGRGNVRMQARRKHQVSQIITFSVSVPFTFTWVSCMYMSVRISPSEYSF